MHDDCGQVILHPYPYFERIANEGLVSADDDDDDDDGCGQLVCLFLSFPIVEPYSHHLSLSYSTPSIYI